MEKFDCIIIGGGASGSFCAIKLAQKGLKVAVVDKNLLPAKKLLVTGNGRCNITNKNLSSKFYNINLDNYFSEFGHTNFKQFLADIGIEIYADEQGRCYPITNSAKSVVKAINNQFEKLKIKFFGEEIFENYTKNGDFFEINLKKTQICAKNLIICAGGNFLSKSFSKEKYIKNRPSLVALKTLESTKKLEGVRVSNVDVTLKVNSKCYTQTGEVLFKDHGISGICVFNLSSVLARLGDYNSQVLIDFLPNFSHEKTINLLKNHAKTFKQTKDILTGMVQEKLATEICSRLKINDNQLSTQLDEDMLNEMSKQIHEFSLNICGCYDNNQVFSGGVDVNCLSQNLQSKQIKNLYFCGECLNVDGECGGYNLQWAYTSASVVAKDILKSKKA